jgi:Flp pilus assembly pilin Flp
MSLLKKFVREEEGLELVEYAVMSALLVAALVIAITTLGSAISTRFGGITTTVQSAGQ